MARKWNWIAVCTVQEIFALFLALNMRTYTKFESQNTHYIGGGAGAGGSVAPPPPPPDKKKTNNKYWGKEPPFHVLVLEDTFTDVFDITSDMADFKAHIHIFCPQTTCELSKKHHESGPPKNCLLMHCDKSKYGHTRHCEDCKEVCLCQRTTRRAFWRIWVGVCAWLSGRCASHPSPPPKLQNVPPPLPYNGLTIKQQIF